MTEPTAVAAAAEPRLADCPYRDRILAAFGSDRSPDFSQGDPLGWLGAIDELLGSGELPLARFALLRLREHAPDLEWPRTVLDLAEMMPDGCLGGPPFSDDRRSDLQVAARPGAKTVVMVFCGRRHQLNMPLWLFQRWMTTCEVSVVYLRDFAETMYLGGVRSCGSYEATVRRLGRIVEEVKGDRIVCLGNSSGGYGAMRYGLELGAERVFGFGAAVNMTPAFNTFLNRNEAAQRLAADFPEATLDLRELYLAAARRPETELFYGAKAWDDRIHAEHMAGVPGAALRPIPDYDGHGVLPELIRRGQFDQLLRGLASTGDAA
jgi:hypothetical protein